MTAVDAARGQPRAGPLTGDRRVVTLDTSGRKLAAMTTAAKILREEFASDAPT